MSGIAAIYAKYAAIRDGEESPEAAHEIGVALEQMTEIRASCIEDVLLKMHALGDSFFEGDFAGALDSSREADSADKELVLSIFRDLQHLAGK